MKHNKEFIRGALAGALAVLVVIGAVSCGVVESGWNRLSGQTAAKSGEEAGSEEAVKTKMELLEALIQNYYTGDVDDDALIEGLYKGYIEALDDPYSVYYNEEETSQMQENTSEEYTGVGALLSQNRDSGIITILKVYKDSPAEEAGIQDNDILYKVEGEEVTGGDLSNVVSRIKGEEGTQVEMTLLRGDEMEEITVTATRRKIETETVTWEMKEGSIGYIRVTEFDTVTYDQYKTALEELEAQGMKGLVVDLRSNPGGMLNTVVEMLDLMLPEGTIVSTRDKQGEETSYDSDEEHQFDKPLAVLVNGNSASASEIYAGAVQAYGVGQVVGTQTFGKGVVQQTFDLKDGTSVKLTIAEYLIQGEISIDGEGVTPDVEIEYEADEENPEYDNQLEKALEILRTQ